MLSYKTLANVIIILFLGCSVRLNTYQIEIPNSKKELIVFIEEYQNLIKTKEEEIVTLKKMTPEILKIQLESNKTWSPSHALNNHKRDIEWAYSDLEHYKKVLIQAKSKLADIE